MKPLKTTKISIVIPVYNEAKRLAACLTAIQQQTLRPYEVIVVDNNSSDDSVEIAVGFPFVKIIHESEQGIVYARNAGFNAASGEIIARIDADITMPAHWLEYIAAYYAVPGHNQTAWTGSGFFYNVRFPHTVSAVYSLLAFRLNRLLLGHPTLWGSNMAITRAQWQEVAALTCQRADIHEDLDLAIHLEQIGYTIVYDTKIKTHAQLKRVRSNRHELWEYLQWWPRTLRVHGRRSWLICWIITVLPLYLAALLLILFEKLATMFGRPPLPRD